MAAMISYSGTEVAAIIPLETVAALVLERQAAANE
jgi:hypothetical protein